MKKVFVLAAFCVLPSAAQTLKFSVQGTALPSAYSFPDTPQNASSSIQVLVTNIGTTAVGLIDVFVTVNSSMSAQTTNFTVTGFDLDSTLAPGASEPFTINFTPGSTGALTGYLQIAYFVEQNGCSFSASSTAINACTQVATVSTLQGNGTPPSIVVSYSNNGSNTVLQPNSTSPLNFGNVVVGSTSVVTFTITNQGSAGLSTPSVSIQVGVYDTSAFQLDTSALPSTLAAGASANFTVTFSPGLSAAAGQGQVETEESTLNVGSAVFPLQGGVIGSPQNATLDSLAVTYTDGTTKNTAQQSAPINFGSLINGTNSSTTLTFILTNNLEADQSFNTIPVPVPQISGAGFSMTGAPSAQVTLQPGGQDATCPSSSCIQFQVTFTPTGTGSFTGTLSIGSLKYTLSGQSVPPSLPSVSFQLSETTLLSQQQPTLTIQLAAPSPVAAVGQLSMQFAPSVPNISDDPAIIFLATNNREPLTVDITAGSQTATVNGQSAIAFQTGTTAGTLTFSLQIADAPTYTQSFTIAPSEIFITSAQATISSPNLVVTMDGYDNTYSAGQLSFLFYDKSGKQISPSALQVNATSDFHNYFFTNDQAGGAFAMQASFPVTGDPTQVGSVAVTLTNSAGQTTKTLTFQ